MNLKLFYIEYKISFPLFIDVISRAWTQSSKQVGSIYTDMYERAGLKAGSYAIVLGLENMPQPGIIWSIKTSNNNFVIDWISYLQLQAHGAKMGRDVYPSNGQMDQHLALILGSYCSSN